MVWLKQLQCCQQPDGPPLTSLDWGYENTTKTQIPKASQNLCFQVFCMSRIVRWNTATFAAKLGKLKILLGNNISREKAILRWVVFSKGGICEFPQVPQKRHWTYGTSRRFAVKNRESNGVVLNIQSCESLPPLHLCSIDLDYYLLKCSYLLVID